MTPTTAYSAAGVSAHLCLGVTPAPDSRRQRAGPTAALMAQLFTQMNSV